MSREAHLLSYGRDNIPYEIIYAQRKTLEIAVHPDCSVVIKAPHGADIEKVHERVKKRVRWIRRQISYFKQFNPFTAPREYVGGETHLYLGKQYRLKMVRGALCTVYLSGGFLNIIYPQNPTPNEVKNLLQKWYVEKAHLRFEVIFDEIWRKLKLRAVNKPEIQVRVLRKRWGSMSKSGRLTLNLDLIRAPKDCIEYVIVHELCHLIYHHHGAQFYRMLDKVMPDWSKRKHKLEMTLR